MNYVHSLTLKQKLHWLIMAASALVLLIIVAATLVYESTAFRPRVINQMQQQAATLEVALQAPLDFSDVESATRYLSTQRALAEMAVAAVYDHDGKLFAAYSRDDVGASPVPPLAQPDSALFKSRQLEYWHAFSTGGYLYLQSDLPPLYARLPQYRITMGTVVLALLLVAMILHWGSSRNILQPLEKLAITTEQVTRNSDYSVRVDLGRNHNDELGALASAFNHMLEAIGERDRDLRTATAHLQEIFSATTEVIVIATDQACKVTVFNAGAQRMLGYTEAEVVGKHTPALWLVPEETVTHAGELGLELTSGSNFFDDYLQTTRVLRGDTSSIREMTFVRKDGSHFPVNVVLTPIHDGNNKISGYLGVAIDLSQRKQAEAQLLQREERFRTLIENASDMITVLDHNAVVHYQSPAAQRVLGYTPEQLLGRSAFELMHPDDIDAARTTLQQSIGSKQMVSLSVRLRHANGSWKHIQVIGRGLDEAIDGGRILINARDVSDSVALEEQLRQSQKLEAIGQLSGGIAHDFNNLLTIISGHALLMKESDQLPADCKDSLIEISRAAKRAAELTRQLLTFSRRQSMNLQSLDLNSVVSDMAHMLRRLLGETINVSLHLCKEPAVIRADANMMEQVLMNFAVNARDAMRAGGTLHITTTVEIFTTKDTQVIAQSRAGKFVCLQIQDNGSGIAPEVMPHIFEPFFTTKEVGKGTGLGLATVYGIVQQHQGWIQCHSEVNKGTRFNVYLPLQEASTVMKVLPVAEVDAAPVLSGDATVLLVEDEPMVRALLHGVLTKRGYRVIEADSSAAAIALWVKHRHEIQLLIADMVIPGQLTGPAFAAQVLKDSPTLPVIYISGYSAETAGKDSPFKQGVNFLAKPFSPMQLLEVMATVLQKSK